MNGVAQQRPKKNNAEISKSTYNKERLPCPTENQSQNRLFIAHGQDNRFSNVGINKFFSGGYMAGNYYDGIIEGLTRHAWWKDGVQYVGTCGSTLKQAVANVEAERQPDTKVKKMTSTNKQSESLLSEIGQYYHTNHIMGIGKYADDVTGLLEKIVQQYT